MKSYKIAPIILVLSVFIPKLVFGAELILNAENKNIHVNDQFKVDLFLDAGLEITPKSLVMGLQHLDWYNADIVIGSKRHPVSQLKYPLMRRIFSLVYQVMVRILFGLNVKDTQVGVKIFKRKVLERILPRLLVKRYAMDIEMLAVSNYLGFNKIYESPVEINYKFDDLTHASTIDSVGRMVWDTVAVFYRLKILHYYDDENRKNWIS